MAALGQGLADGTLDENDYVIANRLGIDLDTWTKPAPK